MNFHLLECKFVTNFLYSKVRILNFNLRCNSAFYFKYLAFAVHSNIHLLSRMGFIAWIIIFNHTFFLHLICCMGALHSDDYINNKFVLNLWILLHFVKEHVWNRKCNVHSFNLVPIIYFRTYYFDFEFNYAIRVLKYQ